MSFAGSTNPYNTPLELEPRPYWMQHDPATEYNLGNYRFRAYSPEIGKCARCGGPVFATPGTAIYHACSAKKVGGE